MPLFRPNGVLVYLMVLQYALSKNVQCTNESNALLTRKHLPFHKPG